MSNEESRFKTHREQVEFLQALLEEKDNEIARLQICAKSLTELAKQSECSTCGAPNNGTCTQHNE